MKKSQRKKYRKFYFKLSVRDQRALNSLIEDPRVPGRILKRALTLRLLHMNQSMEQIADELRITKLSVRNIGNRYLKLGLDRSLRDAPRPGKPLLINRHQEKEIIAVVCSAPPYERDRWTIRLLREEVIRRKIIPQVSLDTLRRLLHQCQVKPWLEKNVVHWGANRGIHPKNGGYT